jgi:glutamyl-tRNA reductase
MFIVDLAVPRDVDPAVGELQDVYLYTIDNLESVIRSNLELRREAATYGEEIVLLQAQDFMSRLESQSSDEAIAAFRTRGERIRDEVLAKAAQRVARGDDPQTVLESLAHTLTNKLLHHPTDGLRIAVGEEDALKIATKLLGLDDK